LRGDYNPVIVKSDGQLTVQKILVMPAKAGIQYR
jgi:hypothetical protein